MRVEFDTDALQALTQGLGRRQSMAALNRAFKRAFPKYRRDLVQDVFERYNMKKKDINAAVGKPRFYQQDRMMGATMRVSDERKPLSYFSPRPTRRTKRLPPGGVTVMVRRGRRSAAEIKDATSKAFWATIGGQQRIIARTTKDRFPVRAGKGPPVGFMISERTSEKQETKDFAADVQKRFVEDLIFRVQRDVNRAAR